MGVIVPFAVPYEALSDYEEVTTPDEDPVHDLVVRRLEHQRIRRMVHELPVWECAAIRLKFGFDGRERTAAEVARALGVGNSTARRFVRQGLDRIAERARDLRPAA